VAGAGPHFPELLERWRAAGPEQHALAQRLAGFADRGLLALTDPLHAAASLGNLVTGEVNQRTLYGTMPIEQDELDRLVGDGVAVFLRAFGPPG
jgi:TetR/AcrR family transcriptional repressor of mexJK operon